MIRLLVILFSSLVHTTLQAQEARNPDARATEILQQLEEKTNTYSDVTYHFSLKIELAESDPQMLKGTFYTRGNQYRLELPDMIFATDGVSQWVVNKEAKEIQIHDYEPLDPSNLSHPQNLLAIHKNPDFDYRLEFEGAEGDKMVQKIEFKPLQRDSEYSKARIILNSRTGHIDTIEVFSKDGSRYYLTIDSTLINQNLSPSFSQIGKQDFPGFHEEDLRLN